MSINQSRFIYTVSVLDCPRPIVTVKKSTRRNSLVLGGPASQSASGAGQSAQLAGSKDKKKDEDESKKRNVILLYACEPDETETRNLALDLTAHLFKRAFTRG